MKAIGSFLLCLAAAAAAGEWPLKPVGDTLEPKTFNLLTESAPRAMKMSETGLKEAGLAAGDFFPKSDEIRIFSSKDSMNESPRARLWLNAKENGEYWYHTGGDGSAAQLKIEPGEAVVVYTRASANALKWENPFRE